MIPPLGPLVVEGVLLVVARYSIALLGGAPTTSTCERRWMPEA
jgi:hypothetical protein